MKWRFLIILVICGAVFCGYKRLTYSPYYVASSTFTINSSITSENSNTYIENATVNQMAKSLSVYFEKREHLKKYWHRILVFSLFLERSKQKSWRIQTRLR
ncbi:MAG: hypothetical protein ACLS54_09100 [Anaerostipes hadrus]